jgi:cytochrome oxidase assembly protein ShyY1
VVLRTAVRPRWLALLALALAAASVMAWLGTWQLSRARESSRREAIQAATSRPAVPLTSLLRPRQSFTNGVADRPVTVSGRWDGAHQLLVADRYLGDSRGLWVLDPLVLDDGSAVAVVRGWVTSVTDPAASTTGLPASTVQVAGVLRPSEPPIDREPGVGSGLPAGQIDGIDLTQLVQRWPQKLITGYVVLTSQDPAPTGALPRPVPPTAPSSDSVAWQNLSYAIQWFVFAGFGLFLWYRLVRDDHLGRLPSGPPRGGRRGDVAPAPAVEGDTAGVASGSSGATEPVAQPVTEPVTERATDTLIDRGAQP